MGTYKTVTLRLAPEEYEALRVLAGENFRTVPGQIRQIIKCYLAYPELRQNS